MRAGPDEGSERRPAPGEDPRRVLQDWITIWSSEFAALTTDREAQEAWLRLIALWTRTAEAALLLLPQHGLDGALHPRTTPDSSRADAPPGPETPVAAPAAREPTLEQLAARIAELERQLAERDRPGSP